MDVRRPNWVPPSQREARALTLAHRGRRRDRSVGILPVSSESRRDSPPMPARILLDLPERRGSTLAAAASKN